MTHITSKDIHGNEYHVPLSELKWRPSCYGIVINNDKILLTKQYGKFELPGGGVELGEDPSDTVVREIKEETGIDVTSPRLVKHMTNFFTLNEEGEKQHRHTILLFFVCEYVGGELSLDGLMDDEKESTEMAEWVPLSELELKPMGSTFDWKSVVKEIVDV